MKNIRLKDGFGMVSNDILRNPEISLKDKGMYAHLATYADVNNELTVSVNRIANECGINQSTAKRSLERLKNQGVIDRIKRGHTISFKTILLK